MQIEIWGLALLLTPVLFTLDFSCPFIFIPTTDNLCIINLKQQESSIAIQVWDSASVAQLKHLWANELPSTKLTNKKKTTKKPTQRP